MLDGVEVVTSSKNCPLHFCHPSDWEELRQQSPGSWDGHSGLGTPSSEDNGNLDIGVGVDHPRSRKSAERKDPEAVEWPQAAGLSSYYPHKRQASGQI